MQASFWGNPVAKRVFTLSKYRIKGKNNLDQYQFHEVWTANGSGEGRGAETGGFFSTFLGKKPRSRPTGKPGVR
jgi:hypothetical protein